MFFSVIVPIYRVEKYLENCIKSVLSQSFGDFELILVDDGSPDACPEICDRYQGMDARVRVIHKENGGLVSARQAGIEAAEGEYIFNLDGDDALEPTVLSRAHEIIKETDAEIVSFSYNRVRAGKPDETIHDGADEGLYQKEDIKKHILPHMLSDENMEHLFYFVWGRAIKKSLIRKHQLGVSTKISLGEDIAVMIPCYLEATRVYFCREAGYRYTIRDDSLSTDFNTKQLLQLAEVIKHLRGIDLLKPDDFARQTARYACFMCLAVLAAAAEGGHHKALGEIRERMLISPTREEMKKASFKTITIKSRITVFLLRREKIKAAYYFLYGCAAVKHILRKG